MSSVFVSAPVSGTWTLSEGLCSVELVRSQGPARARWNHTTSYYICPPIMFKCVPKNCEKRLLYSSFLYFRLSFHMEQLGSQVAEFHEIWYLSIFRKSVEWIQVSLKSDKNNGYCTWRPMYSTFIIIIHLILLIMRNVSDKSCRENQNTHFMFSNIFRKILPFIR